MVFGFDSRFGPHDGDWSTCLLPQLFPICISGSYLPTKEPENKPVEHPQASPARLTLNGFKALLPRYSVI